MFSIGNLLAAAPSSGDIFALGFRVVERSFDSWPARSGKGSGEGESGPMCGKVEVPKIEQRRKRKKERGKSR